MKGSRKRIMPPILLLVLLMLRTADARQAAAEAVKQSAMVVFPALFPFCVVSRWLIQSGAVQFRRGNRFSFRLFGIPASGLGAIAIGLCGGYPLGVQAACELYRSGQLTRQEAQRLLGFCNFTGPGIFFGMAGAVLFQSPVPCAVLYGIHIISALMTGLLLSHPEPVRQPSEGREEAGEPLPQILANSFRTVAALCGSVIFFTVLLRVGLELAPIKRLALLDGCNGTLFAAIVSALVDLPSGISAMAKIGNPAVRLILCSGGIAWGGACVHMQASGLWQEAGVRPQSYYLGKGVQTVICVLLAIPAAGALFGAELPLWPGILPFAAILMKFVIAFSGKTGYNRENKDTEAVLCCFVRKSKNPAPIVPMQSE